MAQGYAPSYNPGGSAPYTGTPAPGTVHSMGMPAPNPGVGFGPGFGGPPAPPQNGGIPFAPGTSAYAAGGGYANMTPLQADQSIITTYNQPTLDQLMQAGQGGWRNYAYSNQMLGLDQASLRNQMANSLGDIQTNIDTNAIRTARSQMDAAQYGKMMGFNTDVFNSQAAGLANTATKNQADINSQAVANGASVASGTNANRLFAANDFFDQYGALAGNYKQQQAMLEMRQGNANLMADVLTRESQNLGMKPGQLQQTLDNGLQMLGLKNQISVGNLLDGISKNNLQAIQLRNQILAEAGQWAMAQGAR